MEKWRIFKLLSRVMRAIVLALGYLTLYFSAQPPPEPIIDSEKQTKKRCSLLAFEYRFADCIQSKIIYPDIRGLLHCFRLTHPSFYIEVSAGSALVSCYRSRTNCLFLNKDSTKLTSRNLFTSSTVRAGVIRTCIDYLFSQKLSLIWPLMICEEDQHDLCRCQQSIDRFTERIHRILSLDPAKPRDIQSLQNWLNGTGCLAREESVYLKAWPRICLFGSIW